MHIKTLTVGPIETNCYIVSDEEAKECAVIDPGAEAGRILDYIESAGLRCRCVFLTHAHHDHTGAVDEVLADTGAALYMSAKDNGVPIGFGGASYTAPEGVRFYSEGDEVALGSLRFRVMETPGHTPGSVCLICGDALFSGDTLFRDSCGRTDFAASNTDDMLRSLRRLAELPGDYEVFPGHMSATTMERERRYNYFVLSAVQR